MSTPELAYVALALRDRDRAVGIFGDDLGLPRHDVETPHGPAPAFGVGRTALVLFAAGDPFLSGAVGAGVDHIALASSDPGATVKDAGLNAVGTDLTGLNGGRQIAVERDQTAGVNVRFCAPLGIGAPAGDHIERIDHIGVASADNAVGEGVFVDRLGCPFESRQTDMEVRTAIESFTSDKYGVVYHTRPPETAGGLRVSFVTAGDCELELLQDFDPSVGIDPRHGQPGTTKQDQSAIGRFIGRYGPGLHHLAFKTPDIDRVLARLTDRGRETIDKAGRPGSRRGRIGFVHPKAAGGVLIHFVEREEI